MKTTENIRNMKRLAITVCTALVFSTGSFPQPRPDNIITDEIISSARLEAMMQKTEQSIRFVAPEVQDRYEGSTDETAQAMNDLDKVAVMTEESIRYIAPETGNEDIQVERTNCTSESAQPETKVFLVENSQERHSHYKNNPDLTQVRYYQKVRKTLWSELKRIAGVKKNNGYKVISSPYTVNVNANSIYSVKEL
jgi:hypothetical protein